jgi:23S rRNA (adenine2503-C2)-methyltransferase
MQDIIGFTLEELKRVLVKWGEPSFRARQIFDWIYQKRVIDFEKMSNLSQGLRRRLKENFSLCATRLEVLRESRDGTKKYLFRLCDGNLVEAVTIPAEGRLTGCLSSQAGCRFKCAFCASGTLGLRRNLDASEMLNEALYLKNNSASKKLTHIVFMGTGEPLDNYANVLKAIRIINADYALNIGARRITVSTCGIIPGIEKLSQEGLQIELSVSLHSADDKVRTKLMPVNKIYPLKELVDTCRRYAQKSGRQVTFEYVMIKGINSGLPDAQKLGGILRGFDSKVNLIPFNPAGEGGFAAPNKMEILLFRDKILKLGIKATLRMPRGEDIDAACGQLRLRYDKK